MPFLNLHPEELVFEGVRLHAAYVQRLSVGNPHDAPVTVEIKCSAAARYQVSPSGPITIPPRGEATLTVRLKVDTFPNRRRGVSGQRDSFHLKGAFFGQKFFGGNFSSETFAAENVSAENVFGRSCIGEAAFWGWSGRSGSFPGSCVCSLMTFR